MNILTNITEMNWLGVLVATIVLFILGGVWFTILFGKAYFASLGREFDPKSKPQLLFIVGPLVCSLITIITSAILINALNIVTMENAFIFGLVVGFGYLVSTMTNIAINPNMPYPMKYALVNAPYFLLSSVIGSLIIVAIA